MSKNQSGSTNAVLIVFLIIGYGNQIQMSLNETGKWENAVYFIVMVTGIVEIRALFSQHK